MKTLQDKDLQVVYRAESQGSFEGPAEYFTGKVRIELLFPDNETAHYSGAYVTFEPGARTAWHLHPAGQHLIVTSGVALTGTRDGKIIEFKSGDALWCPPDIDHWHGATPHAPMTHLALTGVFDGKNVVWKENEERGMNARTSLLFGAVLALLLSVATFSEAQAMNDKLSLTAKLQSIITIAAFTASGNMEKLKSELIEGLNAGLTVNEIKEILIQMYAYAGFPRSLNGISTFMAVMGERQARGIEDEVGREPSRLPPDMDKDEYGAKVRAKLAGQEVIPPPSGYQLFTPAIDTFLKEHLFADIFARDILDYQSRELATIAALASMTGTEGQLWFHLGASMNVGLTEGQLKDFISVLEAEVGREQAEKAGQVLNAVLANRK